jgi:protein ImuB
MQLERFVLPGPVQAMSVEAATTAPLEDRQQELFPDDSTRSSPRRLAGLIERLSSRLSPGAVVRASLRPEAQPELACRYEPLIHGSRRRRTGPAELPPRPLRLLPRPLGLAALSLAPDGPPLQWLMAGRRQQVAHSWGPERIETGWWRGRPIGRDYYRVETTTGRRFWVFRRLHDGKWFLHGMFE